MPSDRTVLEHLLEGRDALVLEVKRLTTAIEELDSVISRIGGNNGSAPAAAETVNSQVEVESPEPPARPRKASAKKAAARKAPARRTAAKSTAGDPQKSIRVHVLEMLGEQDRDYGLAEIIDRIHGLGIQAHDDAVRSITIKLMKDGKVERIGRGQYRLARRGTARPAETPAPAAQPQQPSGGYVPPLNFDQNPTF